MRTALSDFECLVPANVAVALRQQAENPGLIPIAGGTDVLVWMNDGKLPAKKYQSLHRLAGDWRFVHAENNGGLRIGALATYSDVRHHPHVAARFPLLVESARVTGAIQIQNRGTLAGNVANGSPAADTVPVLLVYDARVKLVSVKGEREVALHEFFTGYRKNVLLPGELISEIILPPARFAPGELYYRKVGTREAQAISKVVFAGARAGKDVRMAWGSVAPVTMRSMKTEAAIADGATAADAFAILKTEIAPIDDIRSTKDYRMKVSGRIVGEFMRRTP